jgi:predicted dehydrogenase
MAKQLRFLIAGLGSIGRRHLKNLVSLGQKDITLYRTQHSTLPDEELASYPSVNDLGQALVGKPDGVIISNPTALHLDVAIPSALCGCHLFLEKPISNSLDRINELEKVVQTNEIRVLVGFQYRFHPSLRKIKMLLDEKAVGRVLYTRCQWSEYLPAWHPWEDYREAYSARSGLGGGVVLTLCHPIDYLHWLLGEVHELIARTEKLSDLEINVEDTAEIIMKYDLNGLCCLHLDYIQQPPQHFLEITGTSGMIKWNNADGEVHLYRNSSASWETFGMDKTFQRNTMFLDEMSHFVALVEGNEESQCTLSDGVTVQRIVDAVYRSSQSGCRVKL